jgi:HEAT repeat protein
MAYDEAVALLHVPQRWCEGAAALAQLGDRRAIRPLYRVVARTEEGLPDRGCVRDALDKLGVRDEAAALVASTDVADRRTGIELMKAFPADSHAPILARLALHDPEPLLRSLAAQALRTQNVTATWDTEMIALLDAGDSGVRELAATSLQRRFGAPVLAALRKRLGTEANAAVRGALEAAIRRHEGRRPTQP